MTAPEPGSHILDLGVEWTNETAESAWSALVNNEAGALRLHAPPSAGPVRCVFPGSFNPVHGGHREMAAYAEVRLGLVPEYELSVVNVDKPTIPAAVAWDRARQFAADERVLLSRAPTFLLKAALFPGAVFLVGVDTIERVGDTRYYEGEAGLRAALDEIASRECSFLVFGRRSGDGPFLTLEEVPLPDALRALCQGVSEEQYRRDVSSTALREAARDLN